MQTQTVPTYAGVYNRYIKRILGICIAGFALVGLSPFYLVIAVLITLEDGLPVFYRAERGGYRGEVFRICKFRTMIRNADRVGGGTTSFHDPRITKVGNFLRKTKLDEIPQFGQVLLGKMSLVGPRPELPKFVDEFKETVPLYMVKHQVRPGITGWAQVNGFRGDTSIKGRIEHDIYYIEHWTALFDLKILLMTVLGGKFINSEKIN